MGKSKKSKSKGVYKDGTSLVIREGARFPDRCAICNKEGDGNPMEFVFSREKNRYIEVAAVQAVANAASDFMKGARYTGPVCVSISLCPWHRGRRVRLAGIGLGLLALAIAVIVIQRLMGIVIVPHGELGFLNIALYNFIAIGAGCVGVVLFLMTLFDSHKLWFKPTKYVDRYVWLKGAGLPFLNTLSQYKPGHDVVETGEDGELTAEELIRRAGHIE